MTGGTRRRSWARRLARLTGFRVACIALGIVAAFALAPNAVAALSPASGNPLKCSLRAPDGSYQDRLAPSADHWFGTDAQGCDEFARVVHGARTSLQIGLGAGLLTTAIGTVLGLVAGWRGGWIDAIVRRFADVTLGIPLVVGSILLLSVLVDGRRTPTQIILTLALQLWPAPARIARSVTRTIVQLPYVEAARALGATDARIVAKHVLPNALPAVIAFATPLVGLLIGAEATLSYLGIGLQAPSVSWGLMIEQAQRTYTSSPHLLLFPGAFLVAAIAGFILLGDALNDSLDVHLSHV